jgi:hypothetical protein
VEAKRSNLSDQSDISSNAQSDNIFREKKKRVEQELMKRIIKLKNISTKIDHSFKEQLAFFNQSSAQPSRPQPPFEGDQKYEEMVNFLDEFDAEMRRRTKEMG